MSHRDKVSSIVCFSLGLAVLLKGIQMGFRQGQAVGPGFVPFWCGLFLSLLSLILFLQSTLGSVKAEEPEPIWRNFSALKRVLLALMAVGAYPVVLDRLGFLLSTAGLLFFLFRIVSRLRWRTVGLAVIISVGAAYLIFEVWLGANLPQGIIFGG